VECEGVDHVAGLMQGIMNIVGQEEGVVTRKEKVVATGVVQERSRYAMMREG
jgi:hypothetical protein